jgi:hypothetical protein
LVDASKSRSTLQTIIAGAAERIAMQPWVPLENREAMRATAVSIFEQQIIAVIGADSIMISGWVMPPSQRLQRRERIEAALIAGESVRAVAQRELVTQRWVRRLREDLVTAELIPSEQFRSIEPQ